MSVNVTSEQTNPISPFEYLGVTFDMLKELKTSELLQELRNRQRTLFKTYHSDRGGERELFDLYTHEPKNFFHEFIKERNKILEALSYKEKCTAEKHNCSQSILRQSALSNSFAQLIHDIDRLKELTYLPIKIKFLEASLSSEFGAFFTHLSKHEEYLRFRDTVREIKEKDAHKILLQGKMKELEKEVGTQVIISEFEFFKQKYSPTASNWAFFGFCRSESLAKELRECHSTNDQSLAVTGRPLEELAEVLATFTLRVPDRDTLNSSYCWLLQAKNTSTDKLICRIQGLIIGLSSITGKKLV